MQVHECHYVFISLDDHIRVCMCLYPVIFQSAQNLGKKKIKSQCYILNHFYSQQCLKVSRVGGRRRTTVSYSGHLCGWLTPLNILVKRKYNFSSFHAL